MSVQLGGGDNQGRVQVAMNNGMNPSRDTTRLVTNGFLDLSESTTAGTLPSICGFNHGSGGEDDTDVGSTACFGQWWKSLMSNGIYSQHQMAHPFVTKATAITGSIRTATTAGGSGGGGGASSSSTVDTTTSTQLSDEFHMLSCQEQNQFPPDITTTRTTTIETGEGNPRQLEGEKRWQQQEHQQQKVESFQQTKIQELQQALDNVPAKKKSAYQAALLQDATYLNENPTLLLQFLRSTRYETTLAAERLCSWLEWKRTLFGIDKLCKRSISITDGDLSEDAIDTLQSGRIQIIPTRDTAGRAVIMDFQTYQGREFKSTRAQLQTYWYLFNSFGDNNDLETQQRGIVYIGYGINPSSTSASNTTKTFPEATAACNISGDVGGNSTPTTAASSKHNEHILFYLVHRELFWKADAMAKSLPIQIQASHYCFPRSSAIPSVIPLLQHTVAKQLRMSCLIHQGTHTECLYSLLRVGIPTTSLPITNDGSRHVQNHKTWIERRINKEQWIANGDHSNRDDPTAFVGVDLPKRNDCLLRRGKLIHSYSGNRQLEELIRQRFTEYNSARKIGGKSAVADQIVQQVLDQGGQFLQRDAEHDWWVPASREVAVEKVCHGFRAQRSLGGGQMTQEKGVVSTVPTNDVAPTGRIGAIDYAGPRFAVRSMNGGGYNTPEKAVIEDGQSGKAPPPATIPPQPQTPPSKKPDDAARQHYQLSIVDHEYEDMATSGPDHDLVVDDGDDLLLLLGNDDYDDLLSPVSYGRRHHEFVHDEDEDEYEGEHDLLDQDDYEYHHHQEYQQTKQPRQLSPIPEKQEHENAPAEATDIQNEFAASNDIDQVRNIALESVQDDPSHRNVKLLPRVILPLSPKAEHKNATTALHHMKQKVFEQASASSNGYLHKEPTAFQEEIKLEHSTPAEESQYDQLLMIDGDGRQESDDDDKMDSIDGDIAAPDGVDDELSLMILLGKDDYENLIDQHKDHSKDDWMSGSTPDSLLEDFAVGATVLPPPPPQSINSRYDNNSN